MATTTRLSASDWESVPNGTIIPASELDPSVNFRKRNADGSVTASPTNRVKRLNRAGLRKNHGVQTATSFRRFTETYQKGEKIETFYERRREETNEKWKLLNDKHGQSYVIYCRTREECYSVIKRLGTEYQNLTYKIQMHVKYKKLVNVNPNMSPPEWVVEETAVRHWVDYTNSNMVGGSVNRISYTKSQTALDRWAHSKVWKNMQNDKDVDYEDIVDAFQRMPKKLITTQPDGWRIITQQDINPKIVERKNGKQVLPYLQRKFTEIRYEE